jgi:hypothetical protein
MLVKLHLQIYFTTTTVAHTTKTSITMVIYFGLLSHNRTKISNIKKAINNKIGARSPPLRIIINYKYI